MFSKLSFSDLYLGENNSFIGGAGLNGLSPLPEEHISNANSLREKCQAIHHDTGSSEFSISYEKTDYRVSLLHSIADTIFVLRKFPESTPLLESLYLPPAFVERLLTPKLSGIFIVSGAYASGKTTTASSIVKSRLECIGGVAVTIEDPPEMPLEGVYEKGVCYQTWVQDGDFSRKVKSAARWAPSNLFLGEIRDGETAKEALRASINGIFVICSFHAESIESAVQRFYMMASEGNSSASDVADLMSVGIRGVLHQRLIGEGSEKRLEAEMLWIEDNDHNTKSVIRERKWKGLNEITNLQRNQLAMGLL